MREENGHERSMPVTTNSKPARLCTQRFGEALMLVGSSCAGWQVNWVN